MIEWLFIAVAVVVIASIAGQVGIRPAFRRPESYTMLFIVFSALRDVPPLNVSDSLRLVLRIGEICCMGFMVFWLVGNRRSGQPTA